MLEALALIALWLFAGIGFLCAIIWALIFLVFYIDKRHARHPRNLDASFDPFR